MALIDDVKNDLRISGASFDTEVQMLIDAAKTDLTQSGVVKVVDTDYLIRAAIILYCKGNFGYEDKDSADRFIAEYEKLRVKLALASDYNQYKITFSVYALTTATPLKNAVVAIDDEKSTELITNSQGAAYYYSYVDKVDIDYVITADGYTRVESSVYVDNDETVSVVMT